MQIPDNKYIDQLRKKTGKIVKEYHLINENDRIMIGLSGGKDSMVLLEILHNRKKIIPFDFYLEAVHIKAADMAYEVDENYLTEYCRALGIPFHVRTIKVNPEETKKNPCFACSWKRRKALFEFTREKDCNKLALGHNLDDAIETLLLNMIYHNSISSIPEKIEMFGGQFEIIRPLLNFSEDEIQQYADIQKFVLQKKACPYEDLSKRDQVKQLISQMQKIRGKAKFSVFNSMHKVFPEYLPFHSK